MESFLVWFKHISCLREKVAQEHRHFSPVLAGFGNVDMRDLTSGFIRVSFSPVPRRTASHRPGSARRCSLGAFISALLPTNRPSKGAPKQDTDACLASCRRGRRLQTSPRVGAASHFDREPSDVWFRISRRPPPRFRAHKPASPTPIHLYKTLPRMWSKPKQEG